MLETELDLKTLNEIFFSFYDENATILYSPIPQAIEKIVFIWNAYIEDVTTSTRGGEEIVTIIAECKTENNENIIIQLDLPMSLSKALKILGIKSSIV